MIHPDQKLQDLVTIFTERASTYYYDVFLRIQRNTLSKFHVNWAALIGSFFWSALRASWLLFWIGFCIDLFAAVNIALSYKYALATTDSILNNRSTLAELYNLKSVVHLWIGLSALFLGRPVFAWLADRLYYRQYNSWRIHQETGHGYRLNRLATAVLVVILIAPLTLYRATQFAPEVTSCAKLDRALASQEKVAFIVSSSVTFQLCSGCRDPTPLPFPSMTTALVALSGRQHHPIFHRLPSMYIFQNTLMWVLDT
jgi:glycine betaine/proline transport system permease protein